MNILHYCLGFPPYRTGGLTKYAIDLATKQSEDNEVYVMWPGRYGLTPKVRFVQKKKGDRLHSVEVINPMPVPLLEGIQDASIYMKDVDGRVYEDFLQEHKIEVVHAHTLMGLHKELLTAAKRLGIRVIFTVHDFFGICPKVNFMNGSTLCDESSVLSCENCYSCCKTALSMNKIKILQSGAYRLAKESKLVKKLKGAYKSNQAAADFELNTEDKRERVPEKRGMYLNLREYFFGIFELVDVFHFNSYLTHQVFRRYYDKEFVYEIVPVITGSIKDQRAITEKKDKVHFTFIGNQTPYKGFPMLIEALDSLVNKGIHNFVLHAYSPQHYFKRDYLICHEPYKANEFPEVMGNTDLLLMPSRCNETFGLVALEALSYGRPVLVTQSCGIKDFVDERIAIIISGEEQALAVELEKCCRNPELLAEMNREVLDWETPFFDFTNHTRLMEAMYKE